MAELSDNLRREVWRRDALRCQECGVAVAQKNGCKSQTHHIKPKSAGGSDELDNLITLCLPCHATKDSPNHRKLFLNARPDETPSYIKQGLWELSTELLVYAENLSAFNFPAQQVLDRLQQCQDAVESIKKLTLMAIREKPLVVENIGTDVFETSEILNGILQDVQLSYWSRHQQEILDAEVRGT